MGRIRRHLQPQDRPARKASFAASDSGSNQLPDTKPTSTTSSVSTSHASSNPPAGSASTRRVNSTSPSSTTGIYSNFLNLQTFGKILHE
ncbi:hypothetical protein KP79_PYT00923 [Mizuhopecten yessoensis]|uniref:Uncharacterized protein n=1 Tax=Mizuhopecten yessoensis TaxID=6573 RepID=A0A210QMQ3_MIZYE|nr:hypothetical protein KP79_PYT00923 [Mizuhopecten yessoensis]